MFCYNIFYSFFGVDITMVTLLLKRLTNSFNYYFVVFILFSYWLYYIITTYKKHLQQDTLTESNRRHTILFDRKSSLIAKLVLLIGILLLLGISKNLYKFAPTLKHLLLFKNDWKMNEKNIVCLTIMFNFLSSASIIV